MFSKFAQNDQGTHVMATWRHKTIIKRCKATTNRHKMTTETHVIPNNRHKMTRETNIMPATTLKIEKQQRDTEGSQGHMSSLQRDKCLQRYM